MENEGLTPEEKQKIEDEVVKKYNEHKALMNKIKRGLAYVGIAIGCSILVLGIVAATQDLSHKPADLPEGEPIIDELQVQEGME